jgi:hypothetical protein
LTLRLLFLWSIAWLASTSGLTAQGGRDPVPEIDPYTKNDPATLKRAGYVSYGPFRFGDDHTSFHVGEALGGVPLLWVETEHFRLGSSLDKIDYPSERKEKKRLEGELDRLREKLPRLKRKVKEIDPWLRLHLYAQRLEDLYTDFCKRLDISPEDFPEKTKEGAGPYLGMPEKFAVLLCEKKSSFGRYTATYLGQSVQAPYRYHHAKTGIVFYGTSMGFLGGGYDNDSALHCSLVSGLVKNFVNSAFGYEPDIPFFWREGLAHWFTREVNINYSFFTATTSKLSRVRVDEQWRPKVRARVGHEIYPPSQDMIQWDDPDELGLADHMILWSRIDYLMARNDGLLGKLQRAFKKTALDPRTLLREAGAIDPFVSDFIQSAETTPAEFDEAWAKWVKKSYPKR